MGGLLVTCFQLDSAKNFKPLLHFDRGAAGGSLKWGICLRRWWIVTPEGPKRGEFGVGFLALPGVRTVSAMEVGYVFHMLEDCVSLDGFAGEGVACC
jgi:hypothetical protein